MITRDVPLKVVADILAPSSIAITGDIYGHVSPDVSREAIELLGDAFDQ
jgi:integrase